MKLGKVEKQILNKLIPGQFVPPSVFLGDRFVGCVGSHSTVRRLVYEKKLVVFRFQTYTPEEAIRIYSELNPGIQAIEFNGALKLTEEGENVWKSLTGGNPND